MLEHSREPDAGVGSLHQFSCVARALQACGEESSGVSWCEYSIHMEIPHCSFKIPFPSFKSDSVFLQLINGYCQMNLGKSGARMSLAAVNVWDFLEREGKGVSSDHLFHSLFA